MTEVGASSPQKTRSLVNEQDRSQVATVVRAGRAGRSPTACSRPGGPPVRRRPGGGLALLAVFWAFSLCCFVERGGVQGFGEVGLVKQDSYVLVGLFVGGGAAGYGFAGRPLLVST